MRDKILFLDMDGVVNSNNEIVKYLDDLIENKCYTKEEARKQFNKEFCYYTELIFPIFAKRITDICEKQIVILFGLLHGELLENIDVTLNMHKKC